MASHPIYQFYAELENFEPKVWRRFQVMDNITMARLAYILMTLFEMKGSHLYLFEVDTLKNYNRKFPDKVKKYGLDYSNFKISQFGCIFEGEDIVSRLDKRYDELKDAKDVKVKWFASDIGDEMHFQYDFGDNWWLTIRLEKVFNDANLSGKELPRVIAGEGYGIIEDCGGTGGLKKIREAFKVKNGENYELYSNWLGVDELNLDEFDLDDMNFRLKKLPRIFKDFYEYNLDLTQLTQRSYDILYRNYKN